MKTVMLAIIGCCMLIPGCQSDKTQPLQEDDKGNTPGNNPLLSSAFSISPVYSDSIFFTVKSFSSDEISVKGVVEGFHNITKTNHEVYFQRFVEKEGSFRKIHVIGTAIETIKDERKDSTTSKHFNEYIKFDELGIFEGEPGDPVNLIPLYPGHPVKVGEVWAPVAKIKIAMGEGEAKYQFVIDSVSRGEQGAVIAHITVSFKGDLNPVPAFKNGKVSVSGGGWFAWNCTINQRRDTHLQAVYLAQKDSSEVRQVITVNDSLAVNKGKKNF